jgi:translation initiation factor IF-2
MSDPTASAPPRNPHWLLWEPDLLPMTDPPRPRLTPEPERAPRAEAPSPRAEAPSPRAEAPSPRARATMPPAARSGYAEIIAARTVLRARARLAVAEERHQTFGLQEVRTAPAATPAPERLPRPKWHRLGVPALAVSGALAAPACVVLAFAWIGSPRPPAAPGPARPEAPGIQTAAPRSADGERLALPAGTPPAVQGRKARNPERPGITRLHPARRSARETGSRRPRPRGRPPSLLRAPASHRGRRTPNPSRRRRASRLPRRRTA